MDGLVEYKGSKMIKRLVDKLRQYISDPRIGLPEDIFLFTTEITPMVNVDLIVRNTRGEILLSWRDDEHCGRGWHIPGGIVRIKETQEHRIHKVAKNELGSDIDSYYGPVEVKEIINQQTIRGHFITFVYECTLPCDYSIDNKEKKNGDVGFLKWLAKYPEDMIEVHQMYRDYFCESEKKKGDNREVFLLNTYESR